MEKEPYKCNKCGLINDLKGCAGKITYLDEDFCKCKEEQTSDNWEEGSLADTVIQYFFSRGARVGMNEYKWVKSFIKQTLAKQKIEHCAEPKCPCLLHKERI